MPSVLHVGCGGSPLPEWLGDVDEVRLDIDPSHKPDVVASMTDMGAIGPFDRLYCSHALEHLTPAAGQAALREFHRVLAPGGVAMVVVPDLEGIQPTDDFVYDSPAGPITGRDMYYGLGWLVDTNPHMAHRNGFVAETLAAYVAEAGFARCETRRLGGFNLLAVGVKA